MMYIIVKIVIYFIHVLICKWVMHQYISDSVVNKWSNEAVMCLITLKKEHSGIFSSNLTTQKQAWQKVSEMMCLEGHHFTGEECDRKFRSLKMRQVAHVLYTFSCWPICMFFVLSIILMKVKTTKCDAHLFPCNWSNWFFLWGVIFAFYWFEGGSLHLEIVWAEN